MDSVFKLSERPVVQVLCNWIANIPDRSIDDTVLIKIHEEGPIDCVDLNEIMDVKTTVNFIKSSKSSEKPLITFVIPEIDFYISALTMLCDCKMVEVFGDHNMYITTNNGETVEESDGFYVYEHKVYLANKINKGISLKFVKMTQSDHFWIYGMLLTLKKKPAGSKVSSICFENVEEYMKNSHISEQASKAFNFLKNSNNSQRFSNENSSSTDAVASRRNPDLPAEIRQYIDYKFQILTDYLILREKNVSDKLDRVIDLLKAGDFH